MPHTFVSGARIYWKLEGEDVAPALILLNSIGTDMDLWDGLLGELRGHFRLLRIDTRGHGASTGGAEDYSLALLAQDVLAVAGEAGIGRFAVAGVSLGGMIAMELALAAPGRVERIVPICTSATMDRDAWRDRVAKVRGEGMAGIVELAMGRFLSPAFAAAEPAVAATVRRQLMSMDPAGYAGCAAAIRDMALAERLGGIACPTLVVTGDRDSSAPLAGHGEHLVAGIPGAAHVALDAAHLAPLEAPEALAAAIIPFLN